MFGVSKRKKYSTRYYQVIALKEGLNELKESIQGEDFTTKMKYRFRTIEGILESLRMDFIG